MELASKGNGRALASWFHRIIPLQDQVSENASSAETVAACELATGELIVVAIDDAWFAIVIYDGGATMGRRANSAGWSLDRQMRIGRVAKKTSELVAPEDAARRSQ